MWGSPVTLPAPPSAARGPTPAPWQGHLADVSIISCKSEVARARACHRTIDDTAIRELRTVTMPVEHITRGCDGDDLPPFLSTLQFRGWWALQPTRYCRSLRC